MVSFTSALALVGVLLATADAQSYETDSRELRAAIEADFQAKMLAAVNAERSAAGLQPLCTNKKLQAAAQLHSEDMAAKNFMSHDGSNGSKFSDRFTAQGFKWNGAAENVAAGQVDVASVMKSWMGSPGHKANILGSSKFFGTGYAYGASSTYKHYWTQDFANGSGETCDDGGSAPVPAATTKAPAATTKAPAATTKAPVVTTKAPPATTTKAPAATTKAPTQPPVKQSPRPSLRRTPVPSSTKSPNPTIPKTDCKPIY